MTDWEFWHRARGESSAEDAAFVQRLRLAEAKDSVEMLTWFAARMLRLGRPAPLWRRQFEWHEHHPGGPGRLGGTVRARCTREAGVIYGWRHRHGSFHRDRGEWAMADLLVTPAGQCYDLEAARYRVVEPVGRAGGRLVETLDIPPTLGQRLPLTLPEWPAGPEWGPRLLAALERESVLMSA